MEKQSGSNPVAGDAEEGENAVAISDTVMIYRNWPFTTHGNVFHGIIKSEVYGNRPCAIKYARQSKQNISEAKILNLLGYHTHVVSLIQSVIDQQSPFEEVYLALEPCNELNFRQYLTRRKTEVPVFDINWGFNYCKQIIAGMTHVHDNLIIHRDLKPSNILLSHDFSIAKIADFGSSKQVAASNSMIPFNKAFGTHGYRPPEGIGLPGSFGSLKTDNYSLGLVFYFILSYGESPLGDEPTKWDLNVTGEVLDLSNLQVPNSQTMKHLLSLMLSKDRRRRPSIWQISDHQCWSGKEENCDFDYGFEEEILESNVTKTVTRSDSSEDLAEEIENDRKALKTIVKIILRHSHKAKYPQNDGRPSRFDGYLEKLHDVLEQAESELQLNRGREDHAVQQVKDSILKSGSHSDSEIDEIADHLMDNGHYIRAMIFLKVSYDLSKSQNMSPDSRMHMIQNYVIDIHNAIKPLIVRDSSRYIAETYGYCYIKNLLNDLRKVKSNNKDLLVLTETNCLINITSIANRLHKYEESIGFDKRGVSILESHFGSNASKYQNYGRLLNNLGIEYYRLKQHSEAKTCYLKAIDAFQKCLDFENEQDRHELLKITKTNLALTRIELHKI